MVKTARQRTARTSQRRGVTGTESGRSWEAMAGHDTNELEIFKQKIVNLK